ncbi:MAG TPA: hypothetical protein VK890_02845 [Bacteroidia bacterium]|jgi:hypothetical protein|nr:hypothetical protein [Bacteroidia bacterium]
MAFRLIRNRAQQIAIIGFVVTLAICAILRYFGVETYISMPFLMVWIMVWLLGSNTDRKKTDDETSK